MFFGIPIVGHSQFSDLAETILFAIAHFANRSG